jgi:hypothetical protein
MTNVSSKLSLDMALTFVSSTAAPAVPWSEYAKADDKAWHYQSEFDPDIV